MSLDQQLRDVLTEQAERYEAAPPDFAAMMAGGQVLRRRRRLVVTVSAFVVLAILAAGLAAARGLWDTRADNEPVDWPKPQLVTSTHVPRCVPDLHPGGRELIVGAGPPVATWCTYHGDPRHDGWLWHHAGSTILVRGSGQVFRVADGRLTQLGTAASMSRVVKMSHDGRYAAWIYGCELNVYEVATATELASATTPPTPPSMNCDVDGIDDLGRVYVTVSDYDSGEFEELQMYDLRTGEWTEVVGIPTNTDDDNFPPLIRYVTADGVAAYQDQNASVEGVVDDEGQFVSQREVPVEHGLWSPDRSWFAELRAEGVIVRPATDLTTGQVLDLPLKALDPGFDHLHWESRNSVLVSVGDVGYRCDVRSGSCQTLSRDGVMARGNFWGLYGVYG